MPFVSLSELIDQAIAGAPVSFPTDTVPALGSLPQQAQQLFTLKQRSASKPLILMAANLEDLWPYLAVTTTTRRYWQTLMQQHWPGPLTLVLPASAQLPQSMNPMASGTLGVRIPDHPVARQILAQTGPLATTSANLSGSDSLVTPEAIAATFPQVSLLAASPEHAWSQHSGQPSTVIKWSGENWEILRQGALTLSEIVLDPA